MAISYSSDDCSDETSTVAEREKKGIVLEEMKNICGKCLQ